MWLVEMAIFTNYMNIFIFHSPLLTFTRREPSFREGTDFRRHNLLIFALQGLKLFSFEDYYFFKVAAHCQSDHLIGKSFLFKQVTV